MNDRLKILNLETLPSTPIAISLPASRDGLMPSIWLDGPEIVRSGPEAARASRSARLESDWARLTQDTCGLILETLLGSASLQQSLESRLRLRLDVNGSPEYALTWKHWDMESGLPICALRASARRISDSGCTGWPSPHANSSTGAGTQGREGGMNLQTSAQLAGWPTPVANDDNKSPEAHLAMKKRMGERDGSQSNRTSITSLQVMAKTLAGWNTPRATDGSNGGPNQSGGALSNDARLTGWATPTASEKVRSEEFRKNTQPNAKEVLSGWATPTVRDHKDGESEGTAPVNCLLGRQAWLSRAQTEKPGALNPAFSRWLQGYPVEWCQAAIRASRKLKQAVKRG